jgi:hypothetical protein
MFSKVKAVGVAGAIVTVIIAILGQFGVEVGPELAALITAAVTFVLGWLKTELVGRYAP